MSGTAPAPLAHAAPRLSRRERDFLRLNIFVYLRHGYPEKAAVLAEALHRLGDRSVETLLARAVLSFSRGDHRGTLAALESLDRIAPMERFGSYRLTERQRMRRYLKLRCLHELGETARVRDALEGYMRHGEVEHGGDGGE